MTGLCSARTTKVFVAGLGVVLWGLALWQGIDSTTRLYGAVDQNVAATDDAETLRTVAATAESIDGWLWAPQARIRAGLLYFRLSMSGRPDGVPDRVALDKAVVDLGEGLARAPADAKAWMALAQAQLATGNLEMGKQAFRTSLLIALYDPSLLFWRCQLGLGLWPLLGEDDQRLVASQLRFAWARQSTELLALAQGGNNAAVIAAALDQDPAERDAFEKAFRH
jgi:hypothetical protein